MNALGGPCYLQSVTGHLRLALVFLSNGGKSLISVFEEFFRSIDKMFSLAGGWAMGFHSMGFRHFPGIS